MKKIGIFCSASENIDRMYFESALQIGKWMGETNRTLIYGGANLGLMECIAGAVKESGGTVVGVVPSKLEENGKVSKYLDQVIHTQNLSDRKDIITKEADILVALPGWRRRDTRRDFPCNCSCFYRIPPEKSNLLQ